MAIDFVDIALVEIDGREIWSIKSFGLDTSDPKTAVRTMNRLRRALGATHGLAEFPFKIQAAIPAGELEVDWYDWLLRKRSKLVTFERNDNGQRVNLRDCFLTEVSEKHDDGGESMFDISGFALDKKED